MKLYEIDNAILACVDEESGEIFDIARFEALQMARNEKIENTCLWIKNLTADIESLKAEKRSFEQRIKAKENLLENLKRFMTGYLDGKKFETAKVSVSFRKSNGLNIAEGAKIPTEFLKIQEPEVDKAGLKKAVKNGLCITGVEIVDKLNLQIK